MLSNAGTLGNERGLSGAVVAVGFGDAAMQSVVSTRGYGVHRASGTVTDIPAILEALTGETRQAAHPRRSSHDHPQGSTVTRGRDIHLFGRHGEA